MSARDEILRHPGVLATADTEVAALLDRFAAEERAAALRSAADLISNNVTCGCSVCRARRDVADVLRARANGIAS